MSIVLYLILKILNFFGYPGEDIFEYWKRKQYITFDYFTLCGIVSKKKMFKFRQTKSNGSKENDENARIL